MTFPTEAKKGRRGLASPKQQNQSLIAGASLIDEQSLFFHGDEFMRGCQQKTCKSIKAEAMHLFA
jgi:hypothetical protein